MRVIETDVLIVGVGSAGMAAYKAARKHTDNIITVEHGPYGTTCARVGCMPSKLLIAAADACHAARQAPLFGIRTADLSIDGEAVMRRVRQERDRFVQFSLDEVQRWPQAHKLRGRARFLAPGLMQVGDDTQVRARSVVLATGSAAKRPQELHQQLGERLIVNDDVFDWPALPESVAVLGSGVVGLELAHALNDLGVRVQLLVRRAQVGPATDPDVVAAITALTTAAIPSSLEVKDIHGQRSGEGITLNWRSRDEQHSGQFDYLLAASGRAPNLQALDLPAAGIATDENGMPTFDGKTRQIEGHPVFIAGDVNALHPVLHTAADDGRAAGSNAATWPEVKAFERRAPLNIVFSRPQITMVGASHKQLKSSGRAFAEAAVQFDNQGRARIHHTNQGVLKVYADPESRRFLGAEMVGPAAEHFGHLMAWALQQEQDVDQMLACPFYHPTLEEGLRTALQNLAGELAKR